MVVNAPDLSDPKHLAGNFVNGISKLPMDLGERPSSPLEYEP